MIGRGVMAGDYEVRFYGRKGGWSCPQAVRVLLLQLRVVGARSWELFTFGGKLHIKLSSGKVRAQHD